MVSKNYLIDANELIKTCKEIAEDEWNKRVAPVSWSDAYESFIESIEEQPTVDAVEVVRCDMCYRSIQLQHSDNVECRLFGRMPKEGFCSYGMRSNND